MTTPPGNNHELLDKVLISTKFMRQEMATLPQEDEHETQPTKTCEKSGNVNIIHPSSRMSTRSAILGGLTMMLLFLARPTRAASYPYTEVRPSYSPYMKPSNIAVKSMHQIITQASNLIKLDDAY